MKYGIQRALASALLATLLPACGGGGGDGTSSSAGGGNSNPPGNSPGNPPEKAAITTPTTGSSFAEGAPIQIDVATPDGAAKSFSTLAAEPIAQVDFYQDAALIGTSTSPPYGLVLQGAAPGTHTLSVVTTDTAGVSLSSTPVQVEVVASALVPLRWLPLNSGRTDNLNGVCFTDANNGWVVGENGTILHTTDGGGTWAAQASGTTSALYRVQFVSATQGWTSGSQGTILTTTNGGQSWSAQASTSTTFLTGLSFVSPTTGWVVGSDSTILKTTNGGALWTALPPPGNESYDKVAFVSETTGWTVSGGYILSTSDGGATWGRQNFIDPRPGVYPFTFLFADLRFTSASTGTVVGATHYGNVILTTTDGGATWTTHRHDSLAPHFWAVTFGDARHWWAVGSEGLISASVDGGMTWVTQASPTYEALSGVWFVDANNGWVVGSGGTILKTTTGGRGGS